MTERSFLFARLPTTTKLLQPNFPQEIPGRSAKGGLGFLFRIKTMSRMHRCSMQSPLDIIHWNLVGAPASAGGAGLQSSGKVFIPQGRALALDFLSPALKRIIEAQIFPATLKRSI